MTALRLAGTSGEMIPSALLERLAATLVGEHDALLVSNGAAYGAHLDAMIRGELTKNGGIGIRNGTQQLVVLPTSQDAGANLQRQVYGHDTQHRVGEQCLAVELGTHPRGAAQAPEIDGHAVADVHHRRHQAAADGRDAELDRRIRVDKGPHAG